MFEARTELFMTDKTWQPDKTSLRKELKDLILTTQKIGEVIVECKRRNLHDAQTVT